MWVFGDSIAYWVLKHMLEVTHIANNYYGTRGVFYHNLAVRGAKVQDVAVQVHYQIEFSKKVPTLIIVHVGTNNFNQDQLTLKHAICNLMVEITTMTTNTRMSTSEVLCFQLSSHIGPTPPCKVSKKA